METDDIAKERTYTRVDGTGKVFLPLLAYDRRHFYKMTRGNMRKYALYHMRHKET